MDRIDIIRDLLEHLRFIERKILDEDNESHEQLVKLTGVSKEMLVVLKEINKDLTRTVAVKSTITFGTPTKK